LKILLDHNIDRRLRQYLDGFEVSTTLENGWAELTNGELLSVAEQSGYDVLLTADSNIKYQQNIKARQISIVILRAPNNRLATHVEMVIEVSTTLSGILPGTIVEVFYS
jgi:predicted nuclease of predicted toxin-antitoxin system